MQADSGRHVSKCFTGMMAVLIGSNTKEHVAMNLLLHGSNRPGSITVVTQSNT